MLKKMGALAIAGVAAGCASGAPVSTLTHALTPASLETLPSAAPSRVAEIVSAPLPAPAPVASKPANLARQLPVHEELRRGAILESEAPRAAPRLPRAVEPQQDPIAAALMAEVELALGVGPLEPTSEGGKRAEALPEEDMGELRGGFAGLAFSVFFSGSLLDNGAQTGFLDVNTNGASPAPTGAFSTGEGDVRISASVGEFAGATGIFQIAQVPGNFNVVNNNLFVQIALVNLIDNSQMPSLQSLFGAQ